MLSHALVERLFRREIFTFELAYPRHSPPPPTMTKKAAPANNCVTPKSRLSSGGIFDPEGSSPEKFDAGTLRVGGLVGLADCDMNRTAAERPPGGARDSGAVLLWSEAGMRHIRVPMEAVGIVTSIERRTEARGGDLVEVLWPGGGALAFARRLAPLDAAEEPRP